MAGGGDGRVRVSDRVVATHDGDRIVVVNLDTSDLIALDGTARYLWEAIGAREGGATVDDLVAAVTADFGVEPGEALADVEAFLAALAQAGLTVSAG
ncbi:PqqD family protein [Leifsonia sp. F6_8S_P_1B]|uniref:PqqD family protein n=1 Tax=Leifsonia williamsii TaxID=3035919 RepID=A0ABT8KF49_9MICO|nr:PqqD family protein [Leifsonia williamsii]MDN4616084.1 PqqD family protein [Leifsonia williamsii]